MNSALREAEKMNAWDVSSPHCVLHCARLLVKTERIDIDSERAEGDAGLSVQG